MILRKIGEIGATRCQILRLKCTKFDFRWGSAPDPAGGAYSALPDPLVVFKGPTSKGRRKGRKREWERKGNGVGELREGREGKRGNGKGRGKEGGEGMGACTHWDFRKSTPRGPLIPHSSIPRTSFQRSSFQCRALLLLTAGKEIQLQKYQGFTKDVFAYSYSTVRNIKLNSGKAGV